MYKAIARTIGTLAVVVGTTVPTDALAQVTNEDVPEDTRITIEIENGNWLDIRVYAMRATGIYERIGTVRSFSSKTIELPRSFSVTNNQLQLVASPIGSTQRYAAPPVLVYQGDVVEWRIGSSLRNSTISVRAG